MDRSLLSLSHASLDRTRRTTFNDCFGLDKKEGIPFHRKRSSNLFSLSLSPSLSDDAAAAPLAVHRVWPRQSSKQLYRAQLVRTDMIVHLPSSSLLYCFQLFLRGFKNLHHHSRNAWRSCVLSLAPCSLGMKTLLWQRRRGGEIWALLFTPDSIVGHTCRLYPQPREVEGITTTALRGRAGGRGQRSAWRFQRLLWFILFPFQRGRAGGGGGAHSMPASYGSVEGREETGRGRNTTSATIQAVAKGGYVLAELRRGDAIFVGESK